jgi:hypothetical protein
MFKGPDMANIVLVNDPNNPDADKAETLEYNEIEHFQSRRYVSSMESAWRLFSFEMHDVTRLAIHLPGDEVMCAEEDEEITEEKAAQMRE